MAYESDRSYSERMSDDAVMRNGGTMNNQAPLDYYEPPVESARRGKTKPSLPPKKSKSSKSKQQAQASVSLGLDASANYDTAASQHNSYLHPNDAQMMPPEPFSAENNYPAAEEPAPVIPPRTNSKSTAQQASNSKSTGFSGVIASIRRSFSKKKKAPAPEPSVAVDISHPEVRMESNLTNAFVNDHEHDLQANWTVEPEPEGEVESVSKRKKKPNLKDPRLSLSTRHASVENLRASRQKLILTTQPAALSAKAKLVQARVILLDGEEVTFELDKWVGADVLFARVCDQVNVDVVDQDFFGLTYIQELQLPDSADKGKKKNTSTQKIWFWLDVAAPVYKQQPDFDKWEFRFQVKFYPPDPTLLREDLSRYQLCLQLRQDLYYGKLPCSWVVHALLGSYTVQSELGDYDDIVQQSDTDSSDQPQVTPSVRYIQSFAFLDGQSVELLERIAELHRTHKGLTPEEADLRFLENAKRLPLYGVDLHNALDATGSDIQLGVSSFGMVVYRNGLCLNRFAWPKVVKVAFKQRHFYVYPRAGADDSDAEEVEFRLADKRLAKRLWTIAVDNHAFWRLRTPDALNRRLGSFKRRALSLLSLSNSSGTTPFHFSGRTLYEQRQLKQDAELNDTERDAQSAKFDRLASKRLSNSMPHLLAAERDQQSSGSASASAIRLKAAQSLTSLVLPPPRLGSLRDLTGGGGSGSTRSLRGSQTLPTTVRLSINEPVLATAVSSKPPVVERERTRKPLPVLPAPNKLTIREIELEDEDNNGITRTHKSESDYAVPAKPTAHEQPRVTVKKSKKKTPQPQNVPIAATVERQPTITSVDDGYERLRDVLAPADIDTDSLHQASKKRATYSDSETEIDRVPANYGEQISTLDSDSPTYYPDETLTNVNANVNVNGYLQPAGVTDLDQSAVSGRATATISLKPQPAYSNFATYINSNGLPFNGAAQLNPNVKPVEETNLDDYGTPSNSSAYVAPFNTMQQGTPPLPTSQPPVWPVTHTYVHGDDDDTL